MKREIKTKNSIIAAFLGILFPACMVLGLYIILHGNITGKGGLLGGALIAAGIALLFLFFGGKDTCRMLNLQRYRLLGNVNLLGIFLVIGLGLVYSFFFVKMYTGHIGNIGRPYGAGRAFWMDFSLGFKILAGAGLLITFLRSALNSGDEE